MGCHFFLNAWKWKVKVKSLSHVWPSATPWPAAFQASLFMGFSRQEYWCGVPLPSLSEDLVLPKLKKKKKFSQRNQWGLRGRRTCKMMKPVWVWYHASHGEVSHSLFSQGAWDIVPQTCPSPRLGSWDFTLPLAHPSHPSTNTQLVSPSSCIRPPKTNQRWH